MEKYMHEEKEQLRAIKFYLLTSFRDVLLPVSLSELVFSYLPWFPVTDLTAQQSEAVQLAITQRQRMHAMEMEMRLMRTQLAKCMAMVESVRASQSQGPASSTTTTATAKTRKRNAAETGLLGVEQLRKAEGGDRRDERRQ